MTVESTHVLMIVALAIIIAPTIAGWLRLPGIIGFVLAGTLVGPFVLGLLPAGAVDGIGKIGLLYLMFQAGLEIDMATFKKYRSSAIIFGLLTFSFSHLPDSPHRHLAPSSPVFRLLTAVSALEPVSHS